MQKCVVLKKKKGNKYINITPKILNSLKTQNLGRVSKSNMSVNHMGNQNIVEFLSFLFYYYDYGKIVSRLKYSTRLPPSAKFNGPCTSRAGSYMCIRITL